MPSRRSFAVLPPLLIAVAMSGGCGSSSTPTEATTPAPTEIAIEVAPNVLNIQSEGQVVTVHTSLAYGSVVASSVSMNGVTIDSSKADNQGEFVAKFLMSAIKSLPLAIGALNTLRIEGTRTNGTRFSGSKAILVVNNAGSQ